VQPNRDVTNDPGCIVFLQTIARHCK